MTETSQRTHWFISGRGLVISPMLDQKAYKRAYYLANKEKIKQRVREYYAANRSACIERIAKWSKENPESKRAATRRFYQRHKSKWVEWRRNNPEKARANSRVYVQNRQARLANAQGNFTVSGWAEKVRYHGWKCFYCKCSLTQETVTVDHRIPLSRKALNWLANLVPACSTCNKKKATKDRP